MLINKINKILYIQKKTRKKSCPIVYFIISIQTTDYDY